MIDGLVEYERVKRMLWGFGVRRNSGAGNESCRMKGCRELKERGGEESDIGGGIFLSREQVESGQGVGKSDES